MTPERLEQIRKVIGDESLPDWASKIFDVELLAEVDRLRAEVNRLFDMADNQAAEIRLLRDNFDPRLLAKEIELNRLRAAAEALRAWLTYMDSESEGLQFAQCDDKGRELGLWE